MQKSIMDSQNFRQLKGKSVQYYIDEFRRRALILGINLCSQETLLNYIGGLHSYLRHTILMFNPKNLDEICVQATHLEVRGKQSIDEKSESFLEYEGKGKGKFNVRGKRNNPTKREKEKLTCKHFSKNGHDEDHCWQLHSGFKANKLKSKEKGKTTTIIEHELGSVSGDETKITTIGLKGNNTVSTSSSYCSNLTQDEDRRIELFHIGFMSKNTYIDTLFYSDSQANLISEDLDKKLNPETVRHPRPYILGWI